MTQAALTAFFGWMTVLHFGVLIFATVMIYALGDWATGLHARMFGIDQPATRQTYFAWLGAYKLLIFVFALVPYLALRII